MHNAPVVLKSKEVFDDEDKSFWEYWEEKPKVIKAKELFKEAPWWENSSSSEDEMSSEENDYKPTLSFEETKKNWGNVVSAKEYFKEDECWWRDAVQDLEVPKAISAKEFFKEKPWWDQDPAECEVNQKESNVNDVIKATDFFSDKPWWDLEESSEDDYESEQVVDDQIKHNKEEEISEEDVSLYEDMEESQTEDWETCNDASDTSTMYSAFEEDKILAKDLFAEKAWWNCDEASFSDKEENSKLELSEDELSQDKEENDSSDLSDTIEDCISAENERFHDKRHVLYSTDSEASAGALLDTLDQQYENVFDTNDDNDTEKDATKNEKMTADNKNNTLFYHQNKILPNAITNKNTEVRRFCDFTSNEENEDGSNTINNFSTKYKFLDAPNSKLLLPNKEDIRSSDNLTFPQTLKSLIHQNNLITRNKEQDLFCYKCNNYKNTILNSCACDSQNNSSSKLTGTQDDTSMNVVSTNTSPNDITNCMHSTDLEPVIQNPSLTFKCSDIKFPSIKINLYCKKSPNEKLVTIRKPIVTNTMDSCLARLDASLAWLDATMGSDIQENTKSSLKSEEKYKTNSEAGLLPAGSSNSCNIPNLIKTNNQSNPGNNREVCINNPISKIKVNIPKQHNLKSFNKSIIDYNNLGSSLRSSISENVLNYAHNENILECPKIYKHRSYPELHSQRKCGMDDSPNLFTQKYSISNENLLKHLNSSDLETTGTQYNTLDKPNVTLFDQCKLSSNQYNDPNDINIKNSLNNGSDVETIHSAINNFLGTLKEIQNSTVECPDCCQIDYLESNRKIAKNNRLIEREMPTQEFKSTNEIFQDVHQILDREATLNTISDSGNEHNKYISDALSINQCGKCEEISNRTNINKECKDNSLIRRDKCNVDLHSEAPVIDHNILLQNPNLTESSDHEDQREALDHSFQREETNDFSIRY